MAHELALDASDTLDGVEFAGTPMVLAPPAARRTHSISLNGTVAGASADHIRDHVRAYLAAAWVEEVVIGEEVMGESLQEAVDAVRLAGRAVRVRGHRSLAGLPPAAAGCRWVQQRRDDELSWLLAPRRRSRWQLAIKRSIDVVAALLTLGLLSPLLVAIAIAIAVTSRGPVLYRWRVVGENGRPFTGFKFRTMVPNADELKAELLHLNERSGPVFKISEDPRVTAVGRFLRRHSLDELPQLWSVLAGDMSLVGPRPAFPSEYQEFELWQLRKLSIKPGITCIWQLEGRDRMGEFAEWAEMDLDYIDRWSLWLDLGILLRTPVAVVRGTGR